jgi:uncharacterized protein YegP (UPF0339 family)
VADRKAVFEIYPSGNEYRWRLKAANGEPVASGEGYASKANAKRAVESIRDMVKDATVEETEK